MQNEQNETNFPVKNNLPVNATKNRQYPNSRQNPRHSRPRLRGGRLRRESTRRRAANVAAAKAAGDWTGILYPRHSRDCVESHPFAIVIHLRVAQTAIYRRKWQTPCGGESRR